MRLFDDRARSDPSPSLSSEVGFPFLNRVNTPFWNEVRRSLEEWFGRYPRPEAVDLRVRFRSKLAGDHWSAWWELYLHEIFTRLGYKVILHPGLQGTNRKPDFGLERGDSRLYLEAAVAFSPLKSSDTRAPPWLLDAVNAADNRNFIVWLVRIESAGRDQLRRRDVVTWLEEWLSGLDPDEVTRNYERGFELPKGMFCNRGWEVTFRALPVKPDARGKRRRVHAVGPAIGGMVNDRGQLLSTLKAKAGRYGSLQLPFVIAVLVIPDGGIMDREDIEETLFGFGPSPRQKRDGFWFSGGERRYRRVSAILTGANVFPWNWPRTTPNLWLNPWAAHLLHEEWPFPKATSNDSGDITYHEAAADSWRHCWA